MIWGKKEITKKSGLEAGKGERKRKREGVGRGREEERKLHYEDKQIVKARNKYSGQNSKTTVMAVTLRK